MSIAVLDPARNLDTAFTAELEDDLAGREPAIGYHLLLTDLVTGKSAIPHDPATALPRNHARLGRSPACDIRVPILHNYDELEPAEDAYAFALSLLLAGAPRLAAAVRALSPAQALLEYDWDCQRWTLVNTGSQPTEVHRTPFPWNTVAVLNPGDIAWLGGAYPVAFHYLPGTDDRLYRAH